MRLEEKDNNDTLLSNEEWRPFHVKNKIIKA